MGSGEISESLRKVVEQLALGLSTDGVNLTVTQSGQRIIFQLSISDQACEDCLMPSSVLTAVFQQHIDAELGRGFTVEIDDPREPSFLL